MNAAPLTPRTLTPQEVGVLCGLPAHDIWFAIHAKVLPATFLPSKSGKGGRWYIEYADARAFRQRRAEDTIRKCRDGCGRDRWGVRLRCYRCTKARRVMREFGIREA